MSEINVPASTSEALKVPGAVDKLRQLKSQLDQLQRMGPMEVEAMGGHVAWQGAIQALLSSIEGLKSRTGRNLIEGQSKGVVAAPSSINGSSFKFF